MSRAEIIVFALTCAAAGVFLSVSTPTECKFSEDAVTVGGVRLAQWCNTPAEPEVITDDRND